MNAEDELEYIANKRAALKRLGERIFGRPVKGPPPSLHVKVHDLKKVDSEEA